MHRQSTHACSLALDYYTEIFTGQSNRSQYPDFATFDIPGNSISTCVKNLKTIRTNGGEPQKNAFNRDGLKLTNAVMLMFLGHLDAMYQ